MIRSEIETIRYPNGEIQRVQIVRFDDFASLRFLRPAASAHVLQEYARIYRRFLIPACPWIFGQLVLFRLPQDASERASLPGADSPDPLLHAAALLQKGLRFQSGKAVFFDPQARELYAELERRGCLELASGKLPFLRVVPIGDEPGLLSESEPAAALKVNASFFLLDPFDCATRYDIAGTPFALAVKDGEILSPPLYEREALMVYRDGSVRVERPSLTGLSVKIGGRVLRAGKNAVLYSRPLRRRTPRQSGWDHVVIGRRLVDILEGGGAEIPASGFVLHMTEPCGERGCELRYHGMEELSFAIQAGNSLVKEGICTERFLSAFYNIRQPWRIPYPPSLYPLDYQKARAARIALGADAQGKPMLLWAEGAAKIGYRKGDDSCGASLSEFAHICRDAGMINGVNLDGGGSAQILLHGARQLRISDRQDNGAEQERSVPLGLMIS